MIRERSIVLSILLCFLTCGFYAIYWFIVLTDDAAKVAGDPDFSGINALLFTILTCGIYGIYWNYKMGKVMYEANKKAGIVSEDKSIVYLILALFKFDIINYCIIQDELNKIANISNNVYVG